MRRLILIFVLITFLSVGCEGNSFAKGYVFDAETKAPLMDVQYRDVTKTYLYYTDPVGK